MYVLSWSWTVWTWAEPPEDPVAALAASEAAGWLEVCSVTVYFLALSEVDWMVVVTAFWDEDIGPIL